MDVEEFKELRNTCKKSVIILKFGAEWCKPCKTIKPWVCACIKDMPKNIRYEEIDVDESMDLYMVFKSKRLINGIPAILAFYGDSESEFWFAPDACVSGADREGIDKFFSICIKKANTLES